jgi:hypothetical protein
MTRRKPSLIKCFPEENILDLDNRAAHFLQWSVYYGELNTKGKYNKLELPRNLRYN